MRIPALAALLTSAVVVTGTAVPAQAEGRIFGAGAPGAIPGRYVVTLVDDADTAAFGVRSASAIGGGGTAYTATMTPVQARRLAANRGVRFVEQDRVVHVAAATQRSPVWGLDRIDQVSATPSKTYTPMADGNTVHAYVIDTGIRITHQEFGGRASYGYDAVDNDKIAGDCDGHGTHVAGTIGGAHYGVAKKVQLVAVRVLNCKGAGTLTDVIEGVNWVTKYAIKPAVANMSIGGEYSPSIEAAVQKSINKGITYVAAAGNEDINATNTSPGGLPSAITVGAVDRKDRRASFSNFGKVLDLFAPGVDIRSAYNSSDTAAAIASGTSMASPHVAGAAALVLDAFPSMTPAQVRNFLVAKAVTGKVTDRAGSPNRLLHLPGPVAAPVIKTAAVTVRAGQAYSGKLALATVGRRGWWSLAAGRLPVGLKLTAAGVVSGTPTAPGTATVKVRFIDYVPNTVTGTITVAVQKTTPAIATTTLPAATAGAAYEARLSITGNRAGTWDLAAGELPAGLTLAATGALTGTPVEAGSATFTARFTDTFGSAASREFTFTVGQ
ncbi:MAG TPA: S8 family serine peptidase [Actinoplanes sp.]